MLGMALGVVTKEDDTHEIECNVLPCYALTAFHPLRLTLATASHFHGEVLHMTSPPPETDLTRTNTSLQLHLTLSSSPGTLPLFG